jgi:hypothetical protein
MAVVIASTLPILTSSNAMTMKRRQIADAPQCHDATNTDEPPLLLSMT